MPRGIAHCTCWSCKREFDKELYTHGAGASKALREKIEWAESGGINECPECWKNRKQAENKQLGLTCKILLGNALSEKPRIYAVFGGDSYAQKDILKGHGARWTREYPYSMGLLEAMGLTGPEGYAWVIDTTEMDELKQRLDGIDATYTWPTEEDMAMWMSLHSAAAAERQKKKAQQEAEAAERNAAMQAEIEALGPIPSWPASVLEKWPKDSTWNSKIYGKSGYRNVYFSGQKVMLTDEEASALEASLAARTEWKEKKKAIEKQYGG